MLKFARTFTMVVAVLASMAPNMSAQNTFGDADEKELASYRLTMAAVQKWEKMVRYLADWAKSDPQAQAQIKLQGEVDALEKKEERSEAEQARLEKLQQQLEAMEKSSDDDEDMSDKSIAQIAAEISKFKPAADALRHAGMTPREFVVFSFAMLEAGVYVGAKKQGVALDAKDFNAPNVKFVEQHAAELERLQKEWDKINKSLSTAAKKGS